MLTSSDLSKIKSIVDESIETKLEQKLEQKFDEKLKPIHRKLNKINKTLNTTISFFDKITTNHTKRIKRIEDHLDLPSFQEYA